MEKGRPFSCHILYVILNNSLTGNTNTPGKGRPFNYVKTRCVIIIINNCEHEKGPAL